MYEASLSMYVMELNFAAQPFNPPSIRTTVSNLESKLPLTAGALRSISNDFSSQAVSRNSKKTPARSIDARTSIAVPS